MCAESNRTLRQSLTYACYPSASRTSYRWQFSGASVYKKLKCFGEKGVEG